MTLNYSSNMGQTYIFRSGSEMMQQGYTYTELEKRQLFLRSYHFSRKQSVSERINKSFFKMKKAIYVRFRSARKLRKTLWFKLKNGLFFSTRRRRRFFLLRFHHNYYNYTLSSPQSSCFC